MALINSFDMMLVSEIVDTIPEYEEPYSCADPVVLTVILLSYCCHAFCDGYSTSILCKLDLEKTSMY